ncbi:hypothetical protein [Streptomyces cinerochromogenes]|nr:hypothetical protein [Streptomyces cinerochromogenes]GGT05071.1 hypothetical protein GCM10010206_79230 [Streptomyces cinerochromogenes]
MTAVMVELTRQPEAVVLEPDEPTLVGDVDSLTAGTVPGCNDDNPYQ